MRLLLLLVAAAYLAAVGLSYYPVESALTVRADVHVIEVNIAPGEAGRYKVEPPVAMPGGEAQFISSAIIQKPALALSPRWYYEYKLDGRYRLALAPDALRQNGRRWADPGDVTQERDLLSAAQQRALLAPLNALGVLASMATPADIGRSYIYWALFAALLIGLRRAKPSRGWVVALGITWALLCSGLYGGGWLVLPV